MQQELRKRRKSEEALPLHPCTTHGMCYYSIQHPRRGEAFTYRLGRLLPGTAAAEESFADDAFSSLTNRRAEDQFACQLFIHLLAAIKEIRCAASDGTYVMPYCIVCLLAKSASDYNRINRTLTFDVLHLFFFQSVDFHVVHGSKLSSTANHSTFLYLSCTSLFRQPLKANVLLY